MPGVWCGVGFMLPPPAGGVGRSLPLITQSLAFVAYFRASCGAEHVAARNVNQPERNQPAAENDRILWIPPDTFKDDNMEIQSNA